MKKAYKRNAIRRRRFALGLTQQALAEKSGIPLQSVSLWERGKMLPTPRYFRALAKALEMDPEELYLELFPDEEDEG